MIRRGLLAVLLSLLVPLSVFGLTAPYQELYDKRIFFFDPVTQGCVSGTGSAELDGHRLPATKGGAAYEQHLSVTGPNGDGGSESKHYQLTNVPASDQNGLAGGGAFPTDNPKEEQFYITMRWRYRKWAWNGTSTDGPENSAFYAKHPKVLVTNPRTKKSIIATVIEAGPAPWTGTVEGSSSINNPPSYWQGFIDGTPSQYKGNVAGLSPESHRALKSAPWYKGGKAGDELIYSWAPDQKAEPGPTDLSSSLEQTNALCSGGLGVSPDGFVFPLKTSKAELKDQEPQYWCIGSPSACHHDYKAADISGAVGTPVLAAKGGVVIDADNDVCNGTPNAPSARIYDKSENRWYYYNHMKQGSVRVRTGQKIEAGEQLGVIGPSICAQYTGPHLHFDISPIDNSFSRPGPSDGVLLNPQPVLNASYENLPER